MDATIFESVNIAVLVPYHDDWRFAGIGRLVVAGIRNFIGQAEHLPGFTLKDPFLFSGVDVFVCEGAVGHSAVAVFWPVQKGWFVSQDIGHGKVSERDTPNNTIEILGESERRRLPCHKCSNRQCHCGVAPI